MKDSLLPILLSVMLGLGSCRSKPTVVEVTAPIPNPTPAIAGEVLVGNQGIAQLNRPQGWTDQLMEGDTLNLKMSNESGDAHLTLQTRAKKDLPRFSLEKFAKVGRESGLQTMANLKITGPMEVTSVNGYPAIQYQFRGKVEGTDAVLLHTAIESPNYFHQILAGSSGFGFERHQQTLQKIIQTSQEVPVATSDQ